VTADGDGDEDDRELVWRIINARDERAFGLLYDRHTTTLYRLALRLTGGDAAASQDVVHDAWVTAVPRMAEFEWHSGLSSWLSGYVINLARARLRSMQREAELEDAPGGDDRVLSGTFDRIDLERALASLPHGYREVLVLHDVEGYKHDEIAALLGVTSGTSKSQLSRARAAMRRALRPPHGIDRKGNEREGEHNV
jgi:RNA polymerase sigma-70 factor (ECF subfamily)